jgi:hypothetical protein
MLPLSSSTAGMRELWLTARPLLPPCAQPDFTKSYEHVLNEETRHNEIRIQQLETLIQEARNELRRQNTAAAEFAAKPAV